MRALIPSLFLALLAGCWDFDGLEGGQFDLAPQDAAVQQSPDLFIDCGIATIYKVGFGAWGTSSVGDLHNTCPGGSSTGDYINVRSLVDLGSGDVQLTDAANQLGTGRLACNQARLTRDAQTKTDGTCQWTDNLTVDATVTADYQMQIKVVRTSSHFVSEPSKSCAQVADCSLRVTIDMNYYQYEDLQKDMVTLSCTAGGCHDASSTTKLKINPATGQEKSNYDMLGASGLIVSGQPGASPLVIVPSTGLSGAVTHVKTLTGGRLTSWQAWIQNMAPF